MGQGGVRVLARITDGLCVAYGAWRVRESE